VILLDLKMPKLTGVEVLERLKASPATRYIPVVIFSSARHRPEVQRCYELGVNSYVVKPVPFEEYSQTLGRLAGYWMNVNLCAELR
jgi:two-component system response regulator